jgi:hypothetical protein
MGTDNLFHKKRERGIRDLKRKRAQRSSYDRVLIVCEGEKTEPNYFNELIRDKKLNTANVVVEDSRHGSDPMSVVNCALSRDPKGTEYDRIFCVFDRDRHTIYDAAMDKVRQHRFGKLGKLVAITSVPCFEFWLLLHYEYTAKPFGQGVGLKKSPCDSVMSLLEKNIPGYKKSDQGVYEKTKDKIDDAIRHAKQLASANLTSGTTDPSTEVYKLAQYLFDLKKVE